MQQFSFLFHNFCRVWQCTWSKQKLKQSLLPLCWSPLYIWIFKGNPIHHRQTFLCCTFFLCQIKDFSTLRKRYISHMRWHLQFPVYHRDGVKYRFYAKAHWWMTQDIIIREALPSPWHFWFRQLVSTNQQVWNTKLEPVKRCRVHLSSCLNIDCVN